MTTTSTRAAQAALALVLAAPAAGAQSLEQRIDAAPPGATVRFTVPTRSNVCGDGQSISVSEDSTPGWERRPGRRGMHIGRHHGGRTYCELGPAKVTLHREGKRVAGVVVVVDGTDLGDATGDGRLGEASPAEATRYLLKIAPGLEGKAADHAILGAAIAEGAVIWPRLLEIAKDNSASKASRKSAIFWVSHEASQAAVAGLDTVASDDEADISVRRDAIFHLAQRKNGEGVPALIRVVRKSKHRDLRRDAIWHLSQTRDPRALALFEELLAGK